MNSLFARARSAAHAGGAAAAAFGSCACACAFLLAAPASAKETLVVVTSYPAAVTRVYQQAFAAAHPDLSLDIVKKSGRDAFALLSAPGHGGADVYWAASRDNFPKLSKLGAFTLLKVDRAQLPGKIGPQQLSDPDGRFEAFEVAGYGLAYGPDALWKGKAPPQSWDDAAAADVEGQVVMPIAADVGFAPALYEIILQGEGWTKGWALLSEIGGNSVLTSNPHDLAAIESGRAALGLTIDFIPLNAAAKGLPISLAYPRKTAFLPAYVAELAGAPHAAAAQAFVAFLLSQAGQKLLLAPGIGRHPVRPDAYAAAPDTTDPFALPASRLVDFDPALANARRGLDAALFDAAIVAPHAQMVALWHTIHQAERQLAAHPDAARIRRVAAARRLASLIPVSEAQAKDPKFLAGLGGNEAKIPPDLRAKWASAVATARKQAAALLAETAN